MQQVTTTNSAPSSRDKCGTPVFGIQWDQRSYTCQLANYCVHCKGEGMLIFLWHPAGVTWALALPCRPLHCLCKKCPGSGLPGFGQQQYYSTAWAGTVGHRGPHQRLAVTYSC
eukprot:scaffold242506_cov15-Tisochrysis_lutea.AAC.1